MSNIHLTNCGQEPIHIPGKIQSHGFLIALDPELRIAFYSENIFSSSKPHPVHQRIFPLRP